MKQKMNKKKIPSSIGIVAIIIVAVTVGVFIRQYSQSDLKVANIEENKIEKQNDNTQQKNVAILKEIGEESKNISISGWETYTNKENGYSLKYPSSWISNFVDGASFYVKELQKAGERYPSSGNILSVNSENLKNISGDYFINISIYKKIGIHTSLKEWRKNDGIDYQEILIKANKALKFNENPHKSYDGKNNDVAGSFRYYFIDKNNNGYEITVWYKDSSNGVGEKIISTLSFEN